MLWLSGRRWWNRIDLGDGRWPSGGRPRLSPCPLIAWCCRVRHGVGGAFFRVLGRCSPRGRGTQGDGPDCRMALCLFGVVVFATAFVVLCFECYVGAVPGVVALRGMYYV